MFFAKRFKNLLISSFILSWSLWSFKAYLIGSSISSLIICYSYSWFFSFKIDAMSTKLAIKSGYDLLFFKRSSNWSDNFYSNYLFFPNLSKFFKTSRASTFNYMFGFSPIKTKKQSSINSYGFLFIMRSTPFLSEVKFFMNSISSYKTKVGYDCN